MYLLMTLLLGKLFSIYGRIVKWFTTPGFQSGDVGFDSHCDYCDYSTMVSTVDCDSIDPGSIPGSHHFSK